MLSTSTQHCTAGYSQYSKVRKEINGMHIRKEDVNFLFTDGIVLYIGNPKDSIKENSRTNKQVLARSQNTKSICKNQF